MDELTSALGSVSSSVYEVVATECMDIVLRICWDADTSNSRERLGRFIGMSEDLARRGRIDFEKCRVALSEAFPDVEKRVIVRAIRAFLEEEAAVWGLGSDPNDTDIAETEDLEGLNSAQGPSQGIKGLLYYIAEEDARRKAYEHRGILCNECGEQIRGLRWKCINCRSFDLCSTCEGGQPVHPKTHIFAKIKVPLPILFQPGIESPLWYPGDPQRLPGHLNAGVKKRMSQDHGYEEPAIEALYDQFTCIADVTRAADSSQVEAAIDRVAFNKALTSERWPQRSAPDALYDRMFAFYDEDGDGLIGFQEFVSGMAYLRGPKRFASLRRALKGYDVDGNGYVDRKDFLRLFRAKHIVQQQIVGDWVEEQEREQTLAAVDVLQSSQPISSIFNEHEIPQGEERSRGGKQRDAFGDMQPVVEAKTILDENDPWPQMDSAPRRTPQRASRAAASRERSRQRLSRFEEMLYSPTDAEGPVLSENDGGVTLSPSMVSAAVQEPLDSPSVEADDESFGTEILWQVIEDGFNDMLDPLFAAKETEHNDAISTRAERKQWRSQIERMFEDKRAFEEELQAAAQVDPLMAIALNSYSAVKVERKQHQTEQSGQQVLAAALRESMMATDAESLAAREAEIARQPLEKLLEATGYGMIETVEDDDVTAAPGVRSEALLVTPAQTIADPGEASPAPMLARDLPDATPPSPAPAQPARAGPSQPENIVGASISRQRLELLASHDDVERDIKDRGGAGRLNLDEVEAIVRSVPTGELRGLVTSWLEWASF
ncbi:hypothetical protein LTR08_001676 [Meristemomyces frigidus]|nr:hypothetical protein LTR08_001676 [Meristemomyces frigidus]